MQNRLYAIAKRLWPELEEMSTSIRAVGIGEVFGVLYAAPLALAGLIWLIATTNLDVIRDEWPVLILFGGLAFVFRRLPYTLTVYLQPGIPIYSQGSLSDLAFWSAALIFGPTALWLFVILEGFRTVRDWQQQSETAQYWNVARNIAQDLACMIFAGLIALALYKHWGGAYPPPDMTLGDLAPAFGATLVWFLSGVLVYFPFLAYASSATLTAIGGEASRKLLIRFFAVTIGLPSLIEPFTVLAAGLYGQHGLGTYLFFSAGALLAGLLGNRLSQAVELSHQRTRDMAQLEQLGRAIIDAPPDGSALPDLLATHVPGMFGFSGIEIRLFPDRTLVHHPNLEIWPPVDTLIWEWAHSITEAHTFLPGDTFPWNDETAQNGRLYIPIKDREDDSLLGGIYISRFRDHATTPDLLPAVQSPDAQIASTLHSARTYEQTLAHQKIEQELAFAGEIQGSFLRTAGPPILRDWVTNHPDAPGWQFAVTLESARQTSGDFYDIIPLPGDRVGIVVADVADKGMGAALYMAQSLTLIRTYATEYPTQPAQALTAANRRLLADSQSDLFVTVFYGILDLNTGTLTYCNAGHNPPILLCASDGRPIEQLGRTGIPLGMFDDVAWEEKKSRLEPGSVLALYSDGVTEAQNGDGDLFGEERMLEVLQSHPNDSAAEINSALLTAIHNFASDIPQADDITLVIVVHTAP